MWVPLRSLVAGGNIFEGVNDSLTVLSLPLLPDYCEVNRPPHVSATVLGSGPKEQGQLTMI